MITHNKKINKDLCALLVIDLQERFASAIDGFETVVANTVKAIEGANILDIPVIVTQQYPQGLGETVSVIQEKVKVSNVFDKTTFSALGSSEFKSWLEDSPVKQIILAGIETHVCVAQTAVDLLALGYEVFILEECLSSRTQLNKANGIDRIKSAGAYAYNVESFFFEAMGASTHPNFKEISKLVK